MNEPSGRTLEPLESTDLVAIATEIDPTVTGRTLEYWRSEDLLPRAVRSGQAGMRPVWTYPPDAGRQLEALLRLRQTTRDPNVIRAALWFEGFPVPTSRVRQSSTAFLSQLKAEFEDQLSKFAVETDDEGQARWLAINELARVIAGKRGKGIPRMGRQKLEDRERGVALALGLVLGEPKAVERLDQDAPAVERLFGLDKGRTYRPDGVGPWLDGPASEGLEAFSRIANLDRVIEAIEIATDAELDAARVTGRTLIDGISTLSRVADAFVGRDNASGFGGMLAFGDAPYVGIMMPGFILSILMEPGSQEQINEVVGAIAGSMAPIEETLANLKALPLADLARRLSGLESLPFPERVGAIRLLRDYEVTLPPKRPVT